jgi:hypothetical protein
MDGMDTSWFLADAPPATGTLARGQPHGADPPSALCAGGSVTTKGARPCAPCGRTRLLLRQARCSSPTSSSSSPAGASGFPQPLCTTRCCVRHACSVPAAAVCPGSGTGPPSRGAANRWRSAVAGGRGSRPSGVPEIPSRASGTALRRQGRSVARAAGPRHRRPRLRHRTRRRGAASAASRPPQARARVVEKVRQSAQPPADRSVQRLIPRRRWTAPAHGWAARPRSCPPSARQRARTAATPCLTDLPPKGLNKEGTGAAALCPCD